MFKEKLLICNSSKVFIAVDESKFVERLGSKFPVPIEVFPSSLLYVEEQIKNIGAVDVKLRMAKDAHPLINEVASEIYKTINDIKSSM